MLQAIVEMSDEHARQIHPEEIAEYTGMDLDKVKLALFALADEDPPFFSYIENSSLVGRDIGAVSRPTGYARRTVGSWPTPEALADRLVVALNQAADAEPDQEKRGFIKKTALWLGSAGRDIAVEVAATALAKSAGMS